MKIFNNPIGRNVVNDINRYVSRQQKIINKLTEESTFFI